MRVPPVLLLLVVLALAATGCTRRAVDGLPPGVSVEDLPDSESWNARLRTSADGLSQLEIDAPYLARYDRDTSYLYLGPPPGDTTATPVSIRLFDAEGQPRGSVRAREVKVFEGGARVEAEGDARATVAGSNGAVIDAARLTVEGSSIAASGSVRAEVLGGGARVRASQMTVGEDGAFTASGGAEVTLSGRAQATVRARTVSGSNGRYQATGGVRVVSSGGRTLVAERVVWNESAERFSAPGAFSFDGPGERVRGVGLSASADLSRYSFRRASGEIEVRE